VVQGRLPSYVIRTKARDDLQKKLHEKGIATGLHYPVPLHLQKAYTHRGFSEGSFPASEKAAKEILSLPVFPGLTEAQTGYIANSIREILGVS